MSPDPTARRVGAPTQWSACVGPSEWSACVGPSERSARVGTWVPGRFTRLKDEQATESGRSACLDDVRDLGLPCPFVRHCRHREGRSPSSSGVRRVLRPTCASGEQDCASSLCMPLHATSQGRHVRPGTIGLRLVIDVAFGDRHACLVFCWSGVLGVFGHCLFCVSVRRGQVQELSLDLIRDAISRY